MNPQEPKNQPRLLAFLLTILACSVAVAEEGSSDSPSIGLFVRSVSEVREILKESYKSVPRADGVVVVYVRAYSPAAEAGIKPMDVISAMNRTKIKDANDYLDVASKVEIGKPLPVRVSRATTVRKRTIWRTKVLKLIPKKKIDVLNDAVEKTTDDVRGSSFYQHRDAPSHVSSRTEMLLYIVQQRGDRPQLRLRIQYAADNWLFVKRYVIKINDKTFTIKPPLNAVERGNNQTVWEWYDVDVSGEQLDMLRNIVESVNVTLRYEGQQNYLDHEISLAEQDRLLVMLDLFKFMQTP